MAKTAVKKSTRTNKSKKQSTLQSILNTLASNKLLLFVVTFGVLGVVYIAYSSAYTQPTATLNTTRPPYCKITGKSGWNTPAIVKISGGGISTREVRVSTSNGSYSLPLINNPNSSTKVTSGSLQFRNASNGKVYKTFNINFNPALSTGCSK